VGLMPAAIARLQWALRVATWRRAAGIVTVMVASGTAFAADPLAAAIDAMVARAQQTFDVPGMAVTVVHRGEALLARGYGIEQIGAADRVDDRTLFQIGSVSKAFTAAALAILVDAGELDWDDPVIDHLPEFRMHDAWVTREFTIRDLLTHRSGLPIGAGDLLMFPDGNATTAEVVYALRHLKPATSFRSRFAYDNLLYIVAGEVVARKSGQTFPEFIERRLLMPLGMKECVAISGRAAPQARLATPHVLVAGELETTTTRVTELVAAAGGIACSARGMIGWMTFMLTGGVAADGQRLVSEEHFEELIRPVTLLAVPPYLAEHAGAYLNAYALGWNVSTFNGQPILSHGGGVWGMTTFLAILPALDLAVFASGNQMSPAPRAVVHDVIERVVAGDAAVARDWIAILAGVSADRRTEADRVVAEAFAARNAQSAPSLPLEAYAGTYRDPWYGDVRVSLTPSGDLWFESLRNPPLNGPLEHFQYETFVARWQDRRLDADAYVTFTIAPAGNIERIRMSAVSPATDFSYDFHDLDLRRVD
jgi:CubicO group peptidase (beta-lactamase class C family)